MNPTESLKQLERKAYRSVFSDGIYDIQFALLFLVFAWIPILESLGVSRFVGYGLLIFPLVLPWLGKRYITVPRMGLVEFGPQRRTRRKVLLAVGVVVILLMIPLVIMMVASGVSDSFGWMFIAVVAAPLFVLAVYTADFPRLYIYAAILFFSVVESEFLRDYVGDPFNSMISFGLPGLIILAIGINLLVDFIRTHPRPNAEAGHVN